MAASAITVLKNNVPWGPFTRAQIDEGLARGDFTVRYLAHATGLKEWVSLGEVLDYVDQHSEMRQAPLPPVPEPRDLPPLPASALSMARSTPSPKPTAPPVGVELSRPAVIEQPAAPAPVAAASPPVIPISSTPRPDEKPAIPLEPAPAPSREPNLVAASFFPRAIAFIIDCTILFVPVLALYLFGALIIVLTGWWEKADAYSKTQEWELLNRNTSQLAYLVAIGFGWLYAAFFESSPAQATIGKRWMGLKVTDANGERISFLLATGRYAAKYLSALPCFLGFILALFSSRGLALHDRLTDTRVVRK